MKPTYRRSWAWNLLTFSDLTLGPYFKLKRWFTGFGELSFWWIQICIISPCVGLVKLLFTLVLFFMPTETLQTVFTDDIDGEAPYIISSMDFP